MHANFIGKLHVCAKNDVQDSPQQHADIVNLNMVFMDVLRCI